MASFPSFLTNKKFPAYTTFRALLRGPLTMLKGIVFGLLIAITAVIFFLLVTINDHFLTTVPARGGSLTEGVIGAAHFINPILATTDTDKRLVTLVYGSLMKAQNDGTITPSLAESYTVSPDGKTYTVTLLPNLKFDDKKPLTSDDVAFTVEKMQDNSISTQSTYWQMISVDTPDKNTIAFTLPTADTSFLSHLTFGILPKHIWQTISDQAFQYAKQNILPVGAGPFKVTTVDYSNSIPTSVILTRNPYAPTGTPLLKGFTLNTYANQSDLLNALNAGDVDFSFAANPTAFATTSIDTSLHIQAIPNGQTISIYRSSGDTALNNPIIVSMLNTIIDKNAIIAIVQHGYGTPAGVQQDSTQSTTTKIAPTGFSVAVENDPLLLLAAQTLAQQLQQHGIPVAIKAYNQGTFQNELTTGAVTVFMARNTGVTIPSQYSVVLPLYEESSPYIFSTRTHLTVPNTLAVMTDTEYNTVNDWYTNTDKLWKWFIRKQ
jgi:ABC-type transport system substrate-binding protein